MPSSSDEIDIIDYCQYCKEWEIGSMYREKYEIQAF